ncbi:MAG: helix-hairpin-helix domain-containing protein [Candidatus Sulfotelmatobacter sp.]
MWFLSFLVLAAFADTPTGPTLPPGNGKEIVQRACVGCHALKVVTSKKATPDQWTALVNQMVSRGADVDDDDIDTLVKYLSKNFPADGKTSEEHPNHSRPPAVNVNQATAAELSAALGLSANDAAAVIAYREQNGDFKTLADLIKVPGIDSKKIKSSKDLLRFE